MIYGFNSKTTTGAHLVRQNGVCHKHEKYILYPYLLTKMNMLMEVVTLLYKADICLCHSRTLRNSCACGFLIFLQHLQHLRSQFVVSLPFFIPCFL